MANWTVAPGEIGKYEIALAAATEDTVTFGYGDTDTTDLSDVEVFVHSGAAPVYFRFGSSSVHPATVKGQDCWMCPVGTSVIVDPATEGDTVARLISSAAAVVSVSRAG